MEDEERREKSRDCGTRVVDNRIMEMQIKILLERLQCQVFPHFADANRDEEAAGVTLVGWS